MIFALLLIAAEPASQPVAKIPLSITVSGGVSLGAYEAGYLYYFSETLKRNRDKFDLHVATGASAGSLNALLAALSVCSEPENDPTLTLLFRAWIGVGLKQLFVPGEVKPTALFSRRALQPVMDELSQKWRGGLPAWCDFVFGVATTRLVPKELEVSTGVLKLPRIEEKFVLRIRGEGEGKPPRLDHYVDPGFPLGDPLLPIDGAGKGSFEPIADLLFASAAFPFAFEPVRLRYCSTEGVEGSKAHCTPEESTQDLFIDGGVFDNQPMRLAARAVTHGLEKKPDGGWGFMEVPTRRQTVIPPNMQFWFIDPHVTAYPSMTQAEGDPTVSYWSLAQAFIGSFIETAETKTLYGLFERHPVLLKQVAVGMSYYPTTSSLLAAFFGFFDVQLRIFDFYLGMHDAHRLMEAVAQGFPSLGHDLAMPENFVARDEHGAIHPAWQPFMCMHAVLDEDPTAALACDGAQLEDFRILLQVTIDRLYAHCQDLPAKGITQTSHELCRRGMKGEDPPRVPGIKARKGSWQRGDNEPDLDYTLRLLGEEQFLFDELGLKRKDARHARRQVRAELAKLVAKFTDVQPEASGLLRLAGAPLLNSITYQPPDHILHATVGPAIELGWSMTKPASDWAWLRFSAALSFDGLSSLASSSTPYFGLTPYVGAEFEPLPLSSSTFQWRLGLRAGFLFSTGDGFLSRACFAAGAQPCSRVSTETYLALSLFERLRLQIAAVYLPPMRRGEAHLWAIIPSAGVQFNLPF
ncbi:MAG: patatin-like phospholipase family protein [Deltaproteobacteria bacterium]|nr:patatin-like phospholipase family protein [Deltaproteobacteria bacterium]